MDREFSDGERCDVVRIAEKLFIHKDIAPGVALYQAEKFKREVGLYILQRGEYAKKQRSKET